ncbi:MAG: patatin-like phospholipase family protein [Polyangiaceae bacterium]|jgi:predicted acylesterase/phospholipase RssA
MTYRVLCLDGGGSKGVYTLGVLHELEKMLGGSPLCERFDAVYGTSTGSIIAAAIAVGLSVEHVLKLYLKHIPGIMGHLAAPTRDLALRKALEGAFGDATFDGLSGRCRLGIVATDVENKRPLVFKSHEDMAHGMKASFVPGFGARLADAVGASCSAYPLFSQKRLDLGVHGRRLLMDGGFSANNPSMIAHLDAANSGVTGQDLSIISVGVGQYVETIPFRAVCQVWWMLPAVRLMAVQMAASANYIASMFRLATKSMPCLRINGEFSDQGLATNLLENNPRKLERIYQSGRESFAVHEDKLRQLFEG